MDRLLLVGVIITFALLVFAIQYIFLRKKYGEAPRFWVIVDFIWIFLAVVSASAGAGEKIRDISNTTNKYAVYALSIDAANIREISMSLIEVSSKLSQVEIRSLSIPHYIPAYFSAIYDAAKKIDEKKEIHDSPNGMADMLWRQNRDACLSVLPIRSSLIEYSKANIRNNKAFYVAQFADLCGVLKHFVETAAEENRRNAEMLEDDNFKNGPTRFYVMIFIFAACLRLHKSASDYVKAGKS